MQDNKGNTPTVEERLAILEEQMSSLWEEFGRLQSTITDLVNMNAQEYLL